MLVTIIGGQTLGGQTYHNNGGTAGVTVTSNTTGIYGNFFACGISDIYPVTSTTGTYNGTTVITGSVPGRPKAEISVD